uniref:Uncharacterized protein n=1 Tax=viral metagenome TaxID=1070528 RepID=A0A6C0H786_9ZZZZ
MHLSQNGYDKYLYINKTYILLIYHFFMYIYHLITIFLNINIFIITLLKYINKL